jgi:hypothetical protein
MKTEEQRRSERATLARMVIGGFFTPVLWILAIMQWLGGAGK